MELRCSSSAASRELHSALQRCNSSCCAAWSHAATLRSVESRCSAAAAHAPQPVAVLQRRSMEPHCSSAITPELGAAL
ncbi:unnamed protein product [Sphagnum balticum]